MSYWRHLFRIQRIFWFIGALVALFALVILGGAYYFTPKLADYQDQLEIWASRAINHPVKITKMKAYWRGLGPEVSLSDVKVYDREHKKVLLTIKSLGVHIQVFKSVFYWRLVPSKVLLSGAKFSVWQNPDNSLRLEFHKDDQLMTAVNIAMHTQTFLKFFFSQNKLELNNIALNWHGKNNWNVNLRHLHLFLKNAGNKHDLKGYGVILQSRPAAFKLKLNLLDRGMDLNQVRGKGYIKFQNLLLDETLKKVNLGPIRFRQGLADISLGFNIAAGKVTQIQSLFNVEKLRILLKGGRDLFFDHVSGNLLADPFAGQMELHGRGLNLYLPSFFSKKHPLDYAIGTLVWQHTANAWSITVSQLKARRGPLSLNTNFVLKLPTNKTSPVMNLSGTVKMDDPRSALPFLPDKILNPALLKWLKQSIMSGKMVQTRVTLQGPLARFPFPKK